MVKVLGIDLGTSSSAAAVFVDGDIRLIPSFDGTNTKKPFPSVVSFLESGKILVGTLALEQSLYNPKGTIFNAKRKIGSGEVFNVFDKEYPPEFIEGLILKKIKIDTEYFLKEEITKAVITVPAYFNDNQRQATKVAGEIAGLDVIRVMTEPVAAAVSYGLGKIKEPTKVLVFDMGAGTLDVSVLESDNGYFEVIGTGGDTNLGGIDMDKEISNYLLDEYKKQNGLNVSVDEVTSLQINQLAEKIKIDLTENEEVTVNERFFSNNLQTALNLKITRNDFEKLIEEPILKKCGECIYNVLNDLKMSSDKINKVILVGGPTRIPVLRTFISKILKEPESGVDPEFSVARGAAIEGAVLANDNNLPVLYQGLTLLNVTPLDLGEKAVMKDSELGIKLMIPRNTTYPTEVSQTFYKQFPTSPKIEISVWEGDFQNNYGFYGNVNLGSFWLYVPQRERLEIEVTYKIDADGILTVSAVEKSTGNRDSLKVERGGGPSIPPPQLESFSKEAETFEKEYKKTSYDVLSPYEIPIRNSNQEFSKGDQTSRGENSKTEWLYEALGKAQKIINTHHLDQSDYFAKCNFQFRFDQETDDAFGYVDGTFPNYVIGIHELFSKPMPEDKRFVTMTIVHELLHVIHNDWPEKQVAREEYRIANLAGYFDTLTRRDSAYLKRRKNLKDLQDNS